MPMVQLLRPGKENHYFIWDVQDEVIFQFIIFMHFMHYFYVLCFIY